MVEDLIYKALVSSEDIQNAVTRFNGSAAVFYQQAPHDEEELWDQFQYPRIDYTVDWQYDPERKAAGSLVVNVWCLNNMPTKPPEEIGEIVKACLKDLFMTVDGDTYAAAWSRSDQFEAGGGKEPLTIGLTMVFDVLAFPVQYTTIPDPIEGMNAWIKREFPAAKVIGVDALPELYRPTGDSPAVYCRLISDTSDMRNSYAVAWMVATIGIHVFAPSTTGRQYTCRLIVNALSLYGEVVLTDKSPMLVQKTAISTAGDPLRVGQITVTGRYGILRTVQNSELLNCIGIKREAITKHE